MSFSPSILGFVQGSHGSGVICEIIIAVVTIIISSCFTIIIAAMVVLVLIALAVFMFVFVTGVVIMAVNVFIVMVMAFVITVIPTMVRTGSEIICFNITAILKVWWVMCVSTASHIFKTLGMLQLVKLIVFGNPAAG